MSKAKRPSARRERASDRPREVAPDAPTEVVAASERSTKRRRDPAPSSRPRVRAVREDKAPTPEAAARERSPRKPKSIAPATAHVVPSAAPVAEEDPIFALEQKLDRLLDDADSIAADPHARRRAAEALTELAARLAGRDPTPTSVDDRLLGGARELLSTDYYVRQWSRIGMRNRSEHVDDFGLDPTYERGVTPLLDLLYRKWFRVRAVGVDHVPAEGRALLVANHGGALPWDGLMVRTALRRERGRAPRWLAEDFVYHMPFLGAFVTRVGAVRACPENAERLLAQDEVLTVFPEGIKGIGKLWRERYQLQRFGRGGYVKLALRTGAPIVPVGIVGAEDAYPLLARIQGPASLLGLPFVPVTPLFPWLGPLGLLPMPSRWAIVFGEPIDLSAYDSDAADDALLVTRLNDEVRARVQDLIGIALRERTAPESNPSESSDAD